MMFNIVERYISKLTKDDIRNFALNKDINLSDNELNFTFDFVKKNYKNVLGNPRLFKIERYKNNYSEENFNKISKVWHEYSQRYANYL